MQDPHPPGTPGIASDSTMMFFFFYSQTIQFSFLRFFQRHCFVMYKRSSKDLKRKTLMWMTYKR